jgi:hypothetical protein
MAKPTWLSRCRAWWDSARSSFVTHDRLMKFWILMVPVGFLLRDSVPYVVGISHYAIITGHWSAEEAAKDIDTKGEKLHRLLKWLWVAAIPLSWILRENTPWLVFMSQYAIIVTHWSSKEAAKLPVLLEESGAELPIDPSDAEVKI